MVVPGVLVGAPVAWAFVEWRRAVDMRLSQLQALGALHLALRWGLAPLVRGDVGAAAARLARVRLGDGPVATAALGLADEVATSSWLAFERHRLAQRVRQGLAESA